MNDDLRPHVKAALQRLRNSAPATPPEPATIELDRQTNAPGSRLVAAFAVVIALLGLGALVLANRTDDTQLDTAPDASNPAAISSPTIPTTVASNPDQPSATTLNVPDSTFVPTTSGPSSPADGELPFGLTRCVDGPTISADPSYYRDEPVYVFNEMPVDDVRTWSEQQPGFEDLWIDRDHNGWITVGFAPDVDVAARQRELEALFPNVGVVAAGVPYTGAELEQLRDEVSAAVLPEGSDLGSNVMVWKGRVEVMVGVLDESTLAPLAEFAGRPVCFDGTDPEDVVADGPQPTEGDGWRLLADELTGDPYRTGVATTQEQYVDLWLESRVTDERKPVDFESEIVVWFGAVYGSTCPVRMDDVIVDDDRALVYPQLVMPGNPLFCTYDALPHSFVVAMERDRLPVGPFQVQLDANDPPAGAPYERTIVSVDVSAAGAVATADEIGPDPSLTNGTPNGPIVGPGGSVEVGQRGAWFVIHLPCDISLIGPVNGSMWQATGEVRDGEVDPSWADGARADGTLYVELVVEDDPPRLTLSDQGHDEIYTPASADATSTCT